MNKKDKIYLGIAGVFLLACCIVVIAASSAGRTSGKTAGGTAAAAGCENGLINTHAAPIPVVTETHVDISVVEEGLNKMGTLLTAKYFFKDVVSNDKFSSLWGWKIGLTEAKYAATYEGHVTAGIDFASIQVSADHANKLLFVKVPKAEIADVVIDHDSFTLIDEKTNLINKFTAEEFNEALIELEKQAKERALALGILEDADMNAESLILNFVKELIKEEDYTVKVHH